MPIHPNTSGGSVSITETDPIYTADKPNIALKSEIPDISGFLTTESDPIYTSDKQNIALKSELINLATKTEVEKAKLFAIAMAVAL